MIFSNWPSKNWSGEYPGSLISLTDFNDILFLDFADNDVRKLLQHYESLLTNASDLPADDFVAEAMMEWDDLKTLIYKRFVPKFKIRFIILSC